MKATIVVLMLTLPWWLAPFSIRRIIKTPIDVACEYCDPAALLPNEVADFSTVGAVLSSLGFRPTPPFRMRAGSDRVEVFIQLFDRAETADVASVAGVLTTMAGNVNLTRRTEFRTAFADGTQQWTSNLALSDPYGAMPGVTLTRLPGLAAVPQLYRAHRKLVEARSGAATAVDLEDPIAYQVEFERREREFKIGAGFSYEDHPARVIRPTWRGAFALYFATGLGFRQFRAWRTKRNEAEVLRRLGLDG